MRRAIVTVWQQSDGDIEWWLYFPPGDDADEATG
jgi:hypothetical protein